MYIYIELIFIKKIGVACMYLLRIRITITTFSRHCLKYAAQYRAKIQVKWSTTTITKYQMKTAFGLKRKQAPHKSTIHTNNNQPDLRMVCLKLVCLAWANISVKRTRSELKQKNMFPQLQPDMLLTLVQSVWNCKNIADTFDGRKLYCCWCNFCNTIISHWI